jgi:GNAT superfamily N-acetyltransferase
MDIRTFDHGDIPAALALSSQAGWNHVAADWQRCLTLNPEFCLGGFVDGALMATCTLTPFGTAGWIGTFLVDPSMRGQGHGKALFAAMLEKARDHGVTCLGLDSSDAGRPIYLKVGFQMTSQGVELWTGAPAPAPDPEARPLQTEDWGSLLAFDRLHVKVDREHQLRTLFGEPGMSARIILQDGRVGAFGFSRPGRMTGTIGPVVAREASCACRLAGALMADRVASDGGRAVGLAVPDNPEFKSWLTEKGFQMRRRNIRMFHPAVREMLSGGGVFATTGLGMG